MADSLTSAERLLRTFARRTNLTLPGRGFALRGDQHDPALAQALTRIAGGLGMRPVADGASESLAPLTVDLTDKPRVLLGGTELPERPDADARITFARDHMPVSTALAREITATGVLVGRTVGVCLPLEPKTAVLALLLREAGAAVTVYAHPDETDVEVAEALRSRAFEISADPARTGTAERSAALDFVRSGLDLLIDDGAHLIRLAHAEAPDQVARWVGASEETTSGVRALRPLAERGALLTPVIATNDAATKTAFDNRYGTAQSCVFAIADLLERVGLTLRSQRAVVVGYGPVGQGVAAMLRALDADVAVVETDPLRALLARHDGFETGTLAELAPEALVISATGAPRTVTADAAAAARAVAVAGGTPGEVELGEDVTLEPVDGEPHIVRARPHGTLLLAHVGAANLVAGEGNPIEIMDLSFATQLAALEHLVTARLAPGLHSLPDDAVARVAASAAAAHGVLLDPADGRHEDEPRPGRFGVTA